MLAGSLVRKIITRFAMLVAIACLNSEARGNPSTDRHDRPARTTRRKAHSSRINCLPTGTNLGEVVSYGANGRGNITVEKRLAQLKARCRNRRLLDARGREIRFHRPSCWGNPPADYQDIQQREDEELRKLQKRYTVIVFGCNPMIQ